jgi:hypothetical protein
MAQVTEQELEQAKRDGAQREARLQQAREYGASQITYIMNEKAQLYARIAELDKQQNELLGDFGGLQTGKLEAQKAWQAQTRPDHLPCPMCGR